MRVALAVLTAALLLPASAAASRAVVVPHYEGEALVYSADTGEANELEVHRAGASIVLTDAGADIDPGEGWVPAGAHVVTCSGEAPLAGVDADLGDGDDAVTSDGPALDVQGGTGHDELDLGGGYGSLDGGFDDDLLRSGELGGVLKGGPGPDELLGGAGPDHLMGGPSADSIDGGPDTDTVEYVDHHAGVRVDLSDPGSPAGAEGEADSVANVEDALGGAGDDVLTARVAGSSIAGYGGDDTIVGGDGPDQINGGRGRDSIRGRGGDDRLYGSTGRDAIDAGTGDDYVESSDDTFGIGRYVRDLVACGKGEDSVRPIESQLPPQPLPDVVDVDCEVVWTGTAVPNVRHLRLTDGREALALNAPCVGRQRCLLRVAFRTGGRRVASVKREIPHQRVRTLTATLDAKARRQLEETGRLRLRLVMDVRWGRHLRNRQTTGYGVVVHR
jgi:hemolysin type calcium-binding protein